MPLSKKQVQHAPHDLYCSLNTGHFIMFSVITNIYNKKTKGPTLTEFFTATCVWQEPEYRIDVCRVTRGAHIEHL